MSEEEYIPERDNDLESEEEESNNDLLKIHKFLNIRTLQLKMNRTFLMN